MGRCSDINEDNLTYGNYLDYLPTDEENFYLQQRDAALNYCDVKSTIEAFTELLKDKKTINIPVQYLINIHNHINLDTNQTVDFFAYNEDKILKRRYNIKKYTTQGFCLKAEDTELVDGRYI